MIYNLNLPGHHAKIIWDSLRTQQAGVVYETMKLVEAQYTASEKAAMQPLPEIPKPPEAAPSATETPPAPSAETGHGKG